MKRHKLVEIARLYYEKRLTQQQIADNLGLSRMAISRAINRCHLEGIVEININYEGSYKDLEDMIEEKFNLTKVVIVPHDNKKDIANKFLSEGILSVLQKKIKDNISIGIGWGSTLSSLCNYSDKINMQLNNSVFIPLLGGYGNTDYNIHSNNITSNLANLFKGKSSLLHAPAIVENKDLKKDLISDKHINNIFEKYKQLDIALIGIGCPSSEDATIFQSGYFNEQDIKELNKANIQCDIVSCIYLDSQGKERKLKLLERTIGISAESFKNIPLVIAAAGGINKQLSTKLAIKSGLIHILITDEITASYLLR